MSNNTQKDQILGYFDKIINKTYSKEVGNKLDHQFINMNEVLDYYNRSYGTDFQKSSLNNLGDLSYEALLKQLNHDMEDDMQKDEGKDIEKENIERTIDEQINKSKMPSKSIDKEQILKELSEMTEDGKDVSEKDVKNYVQAATIKAIYLATLERYEKNREQIREHTRRQTEKYGDFTPEDRLAAENRQYEVYLQKLAKQYKGIVPGHDKIQSDKNVSSKEEEIRDIHNKEEELKENKREEEIRRVTLLYEQKEQIEEEMAQMSANPLTFNQNKFEELKDRLYDVDRRLCYEKTSPAVLIENIQRDDMQEELNRDSLGVAKGMADAGVATTSLENEKRENKNNDKIKNETYKSQEETTNTIEDAINEYRKLRAKGDYEGAKQQYEIIKTLSGSKDSFENNIKDVNEDGKVDYNTQEEKDDRLKEELNLNEVNDEEKTAELDLMDAEVDRISQENGIQNKSLYEKEAVTQSEPKQHTLYGNKRPY